MDEQFHAALATISIVVTDCVGIIRNNTILFVMLVASLVVIGFKIFNRAKKAARA